MMGLNMSFALVFETKNGLQTTELDHPSILVGTLPSNHVVIIGENIEPIHAIFEDMGDGVWRVTDLGSETGVYVNGSKVEVEQVLNLDDEIKVGSVSLHFQVIPAPPPTTKDSATLGPKSNLDSQIDKGKDTIVSVAGSLGGRVSKLFSPRDARPTGDVLEIVAYWGDTVLEVEHFEADDGKGSKVTIGRPPRDDFIAAGPKDFVGYPLAKAVNNGYKLRLMDGMKARLRKGGKVERVGQGVHTLSRRDIAHVKYGPISYFLLYVRPPRLELPKSKVRDPLFSSLLTLGALLFSIVSVFIFVGEKQIKEDPNKTVWEIVTVEKESKPIKKEVVKPKVKLVKKPPSKPKPPKPPKLPPPKIKPIKPKVAVKKPRKKVYKQKNVTNTKNNTITGQNAKTPKPVKVSEKTAGGMVKKSNKPNFKQPGKKIAKVKKGPSGGKRGGGNRNVGSARKGKQRASVMGVEGVKNKKSSGVNLSKLGLGVGKVLNKSGPGAINTNFKSTAGGAGGGMGSSSRSLGMGGGPGKGRSLGLGGSSDNMNSFGSGAGGLLSGEGGSGGLGGFGSGRGRGRGRGQVTVNVGGAGGPGISGGLTADQVTSVIRAHLNQIRHCYEQVLQRSPNKSGKIKVAFVVKPNGRVKNPRVVVNGMRDGKMGACVTRKIARWKFPKPSGGKKVDVSYPFVFNPS